MSRGLARARSSGGYERWQRRTDLPLLALALLFLVVLVVPLIDPDLPAWLQRAVEVADILIWAAFALDYLVRLYLAPQRAAFVRTHLVDLAVVVLPLLRPLRALGLLRLLRLASVFGILNRRAQRSLHARVSTYVAAAALMTVTLAAIAMYDAERDAPNANITSLPDALWWAVTTVTTVGYGDRYPTTVTGRLVAVALMVVGIALLGVVTASFAAWFVNRLQRVQEAEERTSATLADVLAELREVRARLDSLEPLSGPERTERRRPSASVSPRDH